jgi:hypothetical protein
MSPSEILETAMDNIGEYLEVVPEPEILLINYLTELLSKEKDKNKNLEERVKYYEKNGVGTGIN